MEENKRKKNIFQFIKFAVVGALNTLVDFLTFTLLTLFFGIGGTLQKGAFTLIAYALGVFNSFIWNSRWTFKQEYKKTTKEKLLFIVVNLISWGTSFLLLLVFTKYVFNDSALSETVCDFVCKIKETTPNDIAGILAKLVSVPIVIIINFIGNKLFVFKEK